MAKIIAYVNPTTFYDKLFEENGELFERNSTKPKNSDQSPESINGYCTDCGEKIIYSSGIPACAKCGIIDKEISFEKRRDITKADIAAREIQERIIEEDIRGNL